MTWPFPSSKNPHFQNEAKCTTFLVKMSFICTWEWKIISLSKAEQLNWFWCRGPGELENGLCFGYQQLYTLQTFYLTSPLSSGNRLIKTKPLFLLTRKNGSSKDAASFPTKCSTKRKINFDRFESPSFGNLNSVLVSQKSDRPHSASLRWHTEDFFGLSGRLYIVIQRPRHDTKLKGDGLIFIW